MARPLLSLSKLPSAGLPLILNRLASRFALVSLTACHDSCNVRKIAPASDRCCRESGGAARRSGRADPCAGAACFCRGCHVQLIWRPGAMRSSGLRRELESSNLLACERPDLLSCSGVSSTRIGCVWLNAWYSSVSGCGRMRMKDAPPRSQFSTVADSDQDAC
jgi:hypothetical protein